MLFRSVWAFPDQFAGIIGHDLDLTIVATVLAVVTLGIQLSIHDVLIDKLHHRQNSWNVGLQIRYFHITDGSARRKLLEFRLELQFVKGIDLFCDMYMIAVGDIVLIGNAWDNAKTLLQALGELVSSRFQWSTVNRIADVLGLLDRKSVV